MNQIDHKVQAFNNTLQKYYRQNSKDPKYFHIYTINIIPTGKNKTHMDTLDILKDRIPLCKSIRSLYLVREYHNTNHFHGIVITKNKTKLLKLCSKRNYHIKVDPYFEDMNNTWLKYILKTNPKYIDIYNNPKGTLKQKVF